MRIRPFPLTQKVAILDKLNAKLGLQKELAQPDRGSDQQRSHRHTFTKWPTAWRAEMQERLGIRQAEIVTARELSEQERR